MAVLVYNVFLFFLQIGIRLAAGFNPKAKQWVGGRKDIFNRLQLAFTPDKPVIWVHCASLGEFEQGRPVIEALRSGYPAHQILLTFFSPSGYENRKNYSGADHIFYLPVDGPANARRFLEITKPSLVIFVKYEFWYYYLKKIKYRNIPLILVSALFREKMSFFKWYGALQRKMLTRFDRLFVQDKESARLLGELGLSQIITISGDTRFDRVASIAATATAVPTVEQFIGGSKKVIIAGSTWLPDEQLLKEVLDQLAPEWKLVIAPHEIGERHLQQVMELFPDAVRYTKATGMQDNQRVMLIDNIGMLSRLYQYGYASYIGGGFGKGIHNTLEAAVFGRPVFFGPEFSLFREAADLISAGAGFSVEDGKSMTGLLRRFEADPSLWNASGQSAADYVMENRGATGKILAYIEEKRLLTS